MLPAVRATRRSWWPTPASPASCSTGRPNTPRSNRSSRPPGAGIKRTRGGIERKSTVASPIALRAPRVACLPALLALLGKPAVAPSGRRRVAPRKLTATTWPPDVTICRHAEDHRRETLSVHPAISRALLAGVFPRDSHPRALAAEDRRHRQPRGAAYRAAAV